MEKWEAWNWERVAWMGRMEVRAMGWPFWVRMRGWEREVRKNWGEGW